MYNIEYTARFKKDYKLALKRKYNEILIQNIISLLANEKSLPARNLINLQAIIKTAGNVIYNPIGY